MSNERTESLLSAMHGYMSKAYEEASDERCAEALEDKVFEMVSFMGYSDKIANHVAQAAAEKLRELSACVYARKSVEDPLAEAEQRAARREAAEATGRTALG